MYIIFLFMTIFMIIMLMKDVYVWIVEGETDRIWYIFFDCIILTWSIVRLRLDLLGG